MGVEGLGCRVQIEAEGLGNAHTCYMYIQIHGFRVCFVALAVKGLEV